MLAGVSLARDGLPDAASGGAADPAELVPRNALVYVHVSLDTRRDPVRRLADAASRFPSYVEQRDRIVSRLASPDCGRAKVALRTASDAGFALFERQAGSGVSLLLIEQEGRAGGDRRRCGALYAENIGDWLAIGQRPALDIARRLEADRSRSLAELPIHRDQRDRLPETRAVDGWVSAAGVRRVLAPQSGLLGLIGAIVDQPRLRGIAFSAGASETGAAVALRNSLGSSGGRPANGDVGELVGDIPDGALAVAAVPRLGSSLVRLSGAGGEQVGSALGALPRDVVALFDRPTVVTLRPATPAPVMTITAKTDDEAAARRALSRMPADVRRAFPSRVAGGTVVLATRRSGLRDPGEERLTSTRQWQATLGEDPAGAGSSLLFLDFTKLLALAAQTGLDSDPAFRSAREDLRRLIAAGARIEPGAGESTVDLSLLIP
ncbi:MAG: hypothetical protein V9E83_01175 [Baekduia sp.]